MKNEKNEKTREKNITAKTLNSILRSFLNENEMKMLEACFGKGVAKCQSKK